MLAEGRNSYTHNLRMQNPQELQTETHRIISSWSKSNHAEISKEASGLYLEDSMARIK